MELSVFERSIPVLQNAGQILKSNTDRKEKAIQVGQNILSAIQEHGMTPELDERCRAYMVNVNNALADMKEGRAAVTQIMDELKKLYTQVENDMDPKKAGTVPANIQGHRDSFAKQQAEERRRKEEELRREAEKKKERIDLVFAIEKGLSAYFTDHLLEVKKKMHSAFNAITLENFDQKETSLRDLAPVYSREHYDGYRASSYAKLHTMAEMNALVEEVKIQPIYQFETFSAKYQEEVLAIQRDLIDKLPSKRAELEENLRRQQEAEEKRRQEEERQRKAEEERQKALAQAREDERKALEEKATREREEERIRLEAMKRQEEEDTARAAEEQKIREEQDRLQMEADALKAKQQAEATAEVTKQGSQTMALFEQEAALAEAVPALEARQGYEIVVLHPAGYGQIFTFWFQNEGMNLALDKLGKTSLDQMKAWCEKKAHKDGSKIENSKWLRYDPTYKAVNKKK